MTRPEAGVLNGGGYRRGLCPQKERGEDDAGGVFSNEVL